MRISENINIATLCCVIFGMFLGFSEAENSKDCPLVPCPYIMIPESCRTTTFFLHGNDQVCQGCDKCIAKSDILTEGGCPFRRCNLLRIPPGCRRETYYVYQGRTICKDCPENTCKWSGSRIPLPSS